MPSKNQFTKEFIRQMTQSSNQNADIYNKLLESLTSVIERLDAIDSNTQRIANNRSFLSQSRMRDQRDDRNNRPFGEHYANFNGRESRNREEESLLNALDEKEFKQRMQRGLRGFADHFGEKLSDIIDDTTKDLQKQIAKKIQTDSITKQINGAISNLTKRIVQGINSAGNINFSEENTLGTSQVSNFSEYFTASLAYLQHLETIDVNLQTLVSRRPDVFDEAKGYDGSRQRSKDRERDVQFEDAFKDRINGFMDHFEKAIIDGLGGAKFQEILGQAKKSIADKLDVESDKLPDELGKLFGKLTSNTLKDTAPGKALGNLFEKFGSKITNSSGGLGDLLKGLKGNSGANLGDLFQGLKGIDFGSFGNGLVNVGSKAIGGLTKLAGTAAGAAAALGIVTVAVILVKKIVQEVGKGLQQMSEGAKEFSKSLSDASNRYTASRTKNIELANERLRQDVKTIIEEPFNILKKAADEVYSAWNANVRLIAGTQGYRKEDLQDLMSAYAQRIESEGLTKVVSSTDIYNNLAKVIESGLTGRAGVEFAYQATRLNAAIPNQDFFSYSESYASVAANAIAAGKSEAEALALANKSLEDFSNSLLYASRGLTGGYATSLKNAESTYSAAVKIAQTARSENLNNIASSLLAIQGYVGSIAPDLASSITEKIYQLATGGNSEDVVALRSLAGINASNTEFLKALASNPKQILSNMFSALGTMFNQSSDAYMEKAESYATLFGLSAEALQRIDFNSLATAIKQMNSNSNALDQNLKLLKEGQTTTTADQLKIEQINKYMIEEGLAYVIDNEAAQMIQQHMWDEQIAREIMEAEYGVNIVGGVAAAIEKMKQGLETIINILNPAAWFGKVADLVETAKESSQLKDDVKQVLELGKVGSGRGADLYNLTTRNKKLELSNSLVELLGGQAKYSSGADRGLLGSILYTAAHPVTGGIDAVKGLVGGIKNAFTYGRENLANAGKSIIESGKKFWTGDLVGEFKELGNAASELGKAFKANYEGKYSAPTLASMPSSQYTWGTITKRSAELSAALLSKQTGQVSGGLVSNIVNIISSSVSVVKEKLGRLLSGDSLTSFIKQGKTYQEWKKSVESQGITDVNQALVDAGYKVEDVEAYYQAKQAEVGMQEKQADREAQNAFMKTGSEFMNVRFWSEHSSPVKTSLTSIHSVLESLMNLHTTWKDAQITQLQSILNHQITWKDAQSAQLQTIGNNQVDWKEFFNTSWLESEWKKNFVGESGLFTKFFQEFVNKFVTHTYYDASGYKYSDVTDIQRREDAEKGSAVYALADALTGNLVDLKDPQVQTNAILAQILVVVSAIMNQNNNVASTVSLSDALSGLALGLTTSTPFDQTPTVS